MLGERFCSEPGAEGPGQQPISNLGTSKLMANKRAALLVRCAAEEGEVIRAAANKEHRTIGGYILHLVLGRIAHRKELEAKWRKRGIRPGAVELEMNELE